MGSIAEDVWTKVVQSVESGSVEEVKAVYVKHSLDYSNSRGGDYQHTVLHESAEKGKAEVVKELVNVCKVDVNVVDRNKDTPLHYACSEGHLLIVQWLVTEGKASVNVVNNDNRTPLQYACREGHLPVVLWLVTEGKASVNVVNKYNRTPLHFACYAGHLPVVLWLVTEGKASVNVVDNINDTPLHDASQNDKIDVVRCLLVELQADFNIRNSKGQTPLYEAAISQKYDVMRVYFEHGKLRGALVLLQHYLELHRALEEGTQEQDVKLNQLREEFRDEIASISPDELVNIAVNPRNAFLFYCGDLYKTLIKVFLRAFEKGNDNPSQLVKLLKAVYISLQAKVVCSDSRRKWLKKALEPDEKFREVILNLSEHGKGSASSTKNGVKTCCVQLNCCKCCSCKEDDGETKDHNAAANVENWKTPATTEQNVTKAPIKVDDNDDQTESEQILDSTGDNNTKDENKPATSGDSIKEKVALSDPGREAGSHSNDTNTIHSKDVREIAKQIWSDYFKEKSDCITKTKDCVKKCSSDENGKEENDKRTIAEQDAVKNQKEVDDNDDQTESEPMVMTVSSVDNDSKHKKEKIGRCFRGVLPHMFTCKAIGKVALFSCVMGVFSYLSDLISDLLVGYEDYTGFSPELGIFEMVLVGFTLLHENINSRRSLYETHEERLRLKLGRYEITQDDWNASELNYSKNKFMRWVYMTICPFRVVRKWRCCIPVRFSVKALLYNILTILMLRPLVDRLVVLLHQPVSLRVFYRQKAEQNSLKQFYLILEQLPELMVQYYVFQIVLNNVSNPHLHEDRYKNCTGKIFKYHQFNQSTSNDTNLICNALPLTNSALLACGIGFRVLSMSIPFFNIPSGILSLEEGFRTLDPVTPKLSSTMRMLLQGCYTLMIPARVFMYATLMHSVHNKSLVILYITGRGFAELAVNLYQNRDNRKTAQRNPDRADERLIKPTEVEMGILKEGSKEEEKEAEVEVNKPTDSTRTRVKRFAILWQLILFSIRDIFLISIRDPAAYLSLVSDVSYDSLRARRAIALRAMVFIAEGFVGALLIEQGYLCGKESNYFRNTGWLYLVLLIFSLTTILLISDLLHPHKHKVKNAPTTFLKKSLVVVGTGYLICSLTCISFFLSDSTSRSTAEIWLAVSTMVVYPLCFGLVIAVIKYDLCSFDFCGIFKVCKIVSCTD